jgi:hypothetical protein
MTGTEERAVAAMRLPASAAAESPRPVRPSPSARRARPPLLARPSRLAGHAWRLWLVPAGAAIAVFAIAVSLALVRSAPESALLPGTKASASGAPGPSGSLGVPPYYVTLPAATGWYAYAPPTPQASSNATDLVVGETATGKRLATVAPPHGLTFNVVTGAADDRTFVVGATSYLPNEKTVRTNWPETWYLLRISPGSAHVAQLARLPVPTVSYVTGMALSPDGTELAVSYQEPNHGLNVSSESFPNLTLWSVATGRQLRRWGTLTGWIAASLPVGGGTVADPFDTAGLATALRWTPDGRELAYAWNGTTIRLLDLSSLASRRTDLIKASRLRAGIGTGYTPAGSSFTCDAADGWSLSTGAKTFTCAGSVTPARPAAGPGCGKSAPAHQAIIQQTELGGGASQMTTLAQSPACTSVGARTRGASLGWSAADGSRVIALLSDGWLAGDDTSRYGVYTKNRFTALPALPNSGSPVTVAW